MSFSSVESIGEHALIDRVRRRAGAAPPWVTIGIGDDAAVIQPERRTVDVVTTDSLVEGVHFRRDWSGAHDIGYKALAVNLSDLAAMGAAPRAVLLSLALPAALPVSDFDALVDGFLTLAVRERLYLVGGNIAKSPGPLVVDVTVIGSAHPRGVLRRSGGRPGDELYVTGSIGGAAAGLRVFQNGARRDELDAATLGGVSRYERPEARVACGVQVGRNRAASACVDLSDGLADAAHQLASASGTGVEIDAEALPVHPAAMSVAGSASLDAARFALVGGEDYELLFAVRAKKRRLFQTVVARCAGMPITRIGQLTAGRGAYLLSSGRREPLPRGFTHFQPCGT